MLYNVRENNKKVVKNEKRKRWNNEMGRRAKGNEIDVSKFELNDKMIMRDAMKNRSFTQSMLASQLGVSQQSIANTLGVMKCNTSLINFVKILDILGYDVVVKDRNGKSGNNWVVKFNDKEETN